MINAWSLLYDELKMDENTFDIKMTESRRYKYSEDSILKELSDYMLQRYSQTVL